MDDAGFGPAADAMFDVVIRNGTIVDGTGMPAHRADVGIVGDRIVWIGRLRGRGGVEIDATGHVVTPGFIDCHTHMDAQVFWDPIGSCSCWHGVTTVVMGHCGFTLAPSTEDGRALVVRNLERAEDISARAMAEGIPWGWTTFDGYLDAVDSLPKGINYAANIGHSALRTWAMGERAFTEVASPEDLESMRSELESALRAGAWGFSTSRTMHHQTSDDRPVASRIAEWSEVEALVRAMGDLGVGMFQFVEDPPAAEARARRDAQLIALASETGVPFVIGATSSSRRPLELIEATSAAGGRMVGMTHPRGIGTMSSFRSQLPFDALPEWQRVRALPDDQLKMTLRDVETRRRLVDEAHNGPHRDAIGGEARRPEFDRMQVMLSPLPPNPTVSEIAADRGMDPVEVMIDLALESDLEVFFVQTLAPFDADSIRSVMKHPGTVMAFSDAGAHVGQMSDASIQTHFLGHWVRDRQDFTLEEAIRMMTLVPATAYGFHDRGLLREGFIADLNIFDPAIVSPAMPTIEHDLPGGERRIVQKSEGFLATIVAGSVTIDRGVHTGILPGRLLRGPLARHH